MSIVEQIDPFLRAGKTEPVDLVPEAGPALDRVLAKLEGSELVDAVEELALFACWLIEKQESPTAGRSLLAIAHRAIPRLDALGANELVEEVCAAERDYDKVLGHEKAAPKLGGPAPPGTEKASPLSRFTLRNKVK